MRILIHFIWTIWILMNIHMANADIFTSIDKMKEIFFYEKRLLSRIKTALKGVDITPEIKEILSFCHDRQEKIKQENFKESAVNIKHPNGAYLMIKHFVKVYKAVRLAIQKTNIPYLESIVYDIPSYKDFDGTRRSLLRLQEVYGLNAVDMANGKYLGHQGPPLDMLDVYEIGLVAFEGGKNHLSIQWFDIFISKTISEDGYELNFQGLDATPAHLTDEETKPPSIEQVVSLLQQSRVRNGAGASSG